MSALVLVALALFGSSLVAAIPSLIQTMRSLATNEEARSLALPLMVKASYLLADDVSVDIEDVVRAAEVEAAA